jgi:hypothetical protein
MGDRPPYSWRAWFALGIAVAGMGLAGYLISRASHSPQPAPPGSTAPPVTQNPSLFGPQSTGGFSVADDAASGQVVVFGGIQDDEATWLWNGTRWNLAEPKVSPPGRIDAATAYDPALHLVLLFGGHGAPGTDLHDTWGWGGTSWRELDGGAGESPPADADMAWDAALDDMVLIAAGSADTTSTTWVWSATHWTRVASGLPTTPAAVAAGFDPSTHRLVAVGLARPPDPPLGQPTRTWTWNGSVWQETFLHGDPVAFDVLAVTWDPVSSQFLLFAGQPSSTNPAGTWDWNGAEWVASATAGQPILDGAIVTTSTSLLLVGALDSTGLGTVTRVQVFSWSAAGWRAA